MNLSEFDQWLVDNHLTGYWHRSTRPEFRPHIWRWAQVSTALSRATELVPMSMVEMRTIGFTNPGFSGKTATISLNFQILMPGEKTRAHRNLKSETRFVVKSNSSAFFNIEGESFPMAAGDLLITPNGAWHDHTNDGDEPVIWLDGLDLGLVNLATEIKERHPQDQQPVDKPCGHHANLLGNVRPSWIPIDQPSPPFRYPWFETHATLMAWKDSAGDPCDGIHLQYKHPVTGGPTLPTFSCEIQLLRPNEATQSHRHNCTTYYYVHQGQGTTTVEEDELAWVQGDVFVVPPWQWHDHKNRSEEEAILFSIADWPTMAALGFYRIEARDE